jgi:hypothetical protein
MTSTNRSKREAKALLKQARQRIKAELELLLHNQPLPSYDAADSLESYRYERNNKKKMTLAEMRADRLGLDYIKFYGVSEWFGDFSNFPLYAIKIKDKIWPASEHYFQAMKFQGTEFEEEIRGLPLASEAAKRGRNKTLPLRDDWNSTVDTKMPSEPMLEADWQRFVGEPMRTKDYIMLIAVRAKFSQHEYLTRLLLSTGDKYLIEHTENDDYWADNLDGTGKNMLGKILMLVREELRRNR